MSAFEIHELGCGCYMRKGDGRWFYRPECPLHGHLYPKGLRDSPILVFPAGGATLPPRNYR